MTQTIVMLFSLISMCMTLELIHIFIQEMCVRVCLYICIYVYKNIHAHFYIEMGTKYFFHMSGTVPWLGHVLKKLHV